MALAGQARVMGVIVPAPTATTAVAVRSNGGLARLISYEDGRGELPKDG
jgi:hypothetical protein